MAVIADVSALVRPPFAATEFTATKWETADEKAEFANKLCRFMVVDFKRDLFTQKLYRRIASTFGHIAHYDKHQFFITFFENLRGKVDFLEQTLMHHPCGDPAWTYSDVERAVLRRLRACHLLDAYRAMRQAEVEGTERELLRRLQAKYTDAPFQPAAPVLH